MTRMRTKVALTGAAGQIGYSLVFRIAAGEMFGPDTEIELYLLELKSALGKLKGIAMELEDCAYPLLKNILITDDPQKAFRNVDWALLVGSVPRKMGMQRKDLLKINAPVFLEQGKALNECARATTKVLVVGNPCNTNAYIAKSAAKNIPAHNFFAMTMLDQNRACAQLAQKAGVESSAIKNLAVWGNHSLTQFPDPFHATINGIPAPEAIGDDRWLKTSFIESVQKRGAEIISARGSSSAASAAQAVIDTVKALSRPTPQGEYFSVAVSSDGSYRVPVGLMFSFPVRWSGERALIVNGIEHNDFAQEKVAATLNELLTESASLQDIIKANENK